MPRRIFAASTLLLGLTLASGSTAPGQERQESDARAWITPTRGPTLSVIRLFAEDLPGLSDVVILAGPAPDRLYPILRGETDPEGDLGVQFKVPAEVDRGERLYFAVDPAGETGPVLAEPPFAITVREDVAPSGV